MNAVFPVETREARIFKNRSNQAIRIPSDFKFDVERVRISREGDKLVIEPIHDNELVVLLDSWNDLDVDFPEIKDEKSKPEEIF